MAKFIIIFFMLLGSGASYFTYQGTGQEDVQSLKKETSIRSNSYRGSSSSSYNSSSYGYGK